MKFFVQKVHPLTSSGLNSRLSWGFSRSLRKNDHHHCAQDALLNRIFGCTGKQISKVLPDHLREDRVLATDVADWLLLLGSRMLHGRDQYRHLLTLLLAHFLIAPFSMFFVALTTGSTSDIVHLETRFSCLLIKPLHSIFPFWMGTT
jgi:hypothetical protein